MEGSVTVLILGLAPLIIFLAAGLGLAVASTLAAQRPRVDDSLRTSGEAGHADPHRQPSARR